MDAAIHSIFKGAFTQAQSFQDLLFDELKADRDKPFSIPVFEPLNQLSPSSLPKAFEGCFNKRVFIYRPATPMQHAAHCVVGEDQLRIVYSSDLNHCWARFLVAKELAHSFFYQQENQQVLLTSTTDELVQLIRELNSNMQIRDGSPATMVDQTATVLALELLVPSRWMGKIREAYTRLQDDSSIQSGTECLEIARYFRVPERLLELRLVEGFSLDNFYNEYLEAQTEPA